MKTKLFVLFFITVISFSGFGQTTNKIVVRGTSVIEIEPEIVDFSIIYRYSDNVKENERIIEQDKMLKAILPQFSIPMDNLLVDNISASGWGGFSKVGNTNISLSKSYRLRYNSTNQIDLLISKLIQTGADNVYVSNLESSKLDSVKKLTMLNALDNAKIKAKEIADKVGGTLGKANVITEIFPSKSYQTDSRDEYYKISTINVRGVGVYQDTDIQSLNMRKIRVSTTYEIEFELK